MTVRLLLLLAVASAPIACDGTETTRDTPGPDGGGPPPGDPDATLDAGPDLDAAPDADLDAGVDATVDAGPDAGPRAPTPAFERYCQSAPWTDTLQAATPGKLSGQYVGVLTGLDPEHPFSSRTFETMKVVPEHPFWLKKLRIALAGSGQVTLRVTTTFGRSYPGFWPDPRDFSTDVIPEDIIFDVTDADPNTWIERDISDLGVYLEPTQHYMIEYQHSSPDGPFLAIEGVPPGEYSRALLFHLPGQDAYGIPGATAGTAGNYRLEAEGEYFCAWTDAERWFSEPGPTAFAEARSEKVMVTDLDGDGHDDIVTAGPKAFLGDGTGAFTAPDFDPFVDAPRPSVLVFGDVDNDGDQDAFAGYWVGRSSDGDQYEVGGEGQPDCDDTDPQVHPDAPEIADNGKDDDCDGVADDGTSTADADQDGFSIAAGDRDDTRADVYPGAPELPDARDNDCDGLVDEDWTHRVLLNDGTGHFARVESAGVESLSPGTSAAFGDTNGDGRLDLYLGNWLVHYPDDPAVQDDFWTGNGDGTFVAALDEAGMRLPTPLSSYGVTFTDYDDDGLQDLYVSNYHLYANQLWRNQGDGTFRDVAEDVGLAHDDIESPIPQYLGGHTYGADFADFDNDGDLDAYICNLAHPRVQPWSDPSMFMVAQGPPDHRFTNATTEHGFIYDEGDVNAIFADFDNDGDLDVAVASLYTGHYSRLYRNDGEAGFIDITYEARAAVHDSVSVAWSDVDEDGDLDLLIASREANGPWVHLLMNQVGDRHGWVELDLQGTTTNRDAIGARVTLSACGKQQMREVHGGQGFGNSQQTHTVHFGVGECAEIDQVDVRWVGGATETISGIAPRHRYRVIEGSGVAVQR